MRVVEKNLNSSSYHNLFPFFWQPVGNLASSKIHIFISFSLAFSIIKSKDCLQHF